MAKRTALVLEDEPLIAMDVEITLRDAGFDASIVETCTEANEWLEVCRPDVAIVDIMLRDGPCHDIVAQLVKDGIPFVVHSGDQIGMHTGTPFVGGMWVNKPSLATDLMDAITRATSSQQRN